MVKKWIFKILFLTLIIVVGGGALWIWGALKYKYSTGERAGYLQKVSYKGWLIKTWEGELAMVNLPGAMPEIFHFSARDPDAIQALQGLAGQRVLLRYAEHRGLPPRIFGDTNYFVTEVQIIPDDLKK